MNHIFLTLSLLSISTFSQAGDLNSKIRNGIPAQYKDDTRFSGTALNRLDNGKKLTLLGVIRRSAKMEKVFEKLEDYAGRSQGRKAR